MGVGWGFHIPAAVISVSGPIPSDPPQQKQLLGRPPTLGGGGVERRKREDGKWKMEYG